MLKCGVDAEGLHQPGRLHLQGFALGGTKHGWVRTREKGHTLDSAGCMRIEGDATLTGTMAVYTCTYS